MSLDTTCQRYGYDATGRYHVPPVDRDQCGECRCPPEGKHAEGCGNPFPEVLYEMLDKAVDTDALGNEQAHDCEQGEEADKDADISVPFGVQSWIFEALAECELVKLHDLIDEHHEWIVEMARERHRVGY